MMSDVLMESLFKVSGHDLLGGFGQKSDLFRGYV